MGAINYFFEEVKETKQVPTKTWIKKCLLKEGFEAGGINFIFCSDAYLRGINKKYLKRDYLTDVISFPNELEKKKDLKVVFGDIFISIDRVKDNKSIYKTIFAIELKRVMIHGVLHLIGYRDSNTKEKKIMTEKENFYIKLK